DPTIGEESVLPYLVGPPLGSIELLFPIDAQTVLRGRSRRRPLHHIKLTDRPEIKLINRFTARFGYRFVFARDPGHEPLIIKYAATSPVPKSVTVPGSERGKIVLTQWVFGPRPQKPKWDG